MRIEGFMIQDLCTTDVEILDNFNLCKETFARYGLYVKFPKNADINKTYQWRLMLKLTNQFNEWGFDHSCKLAFLESIVSQTPSHLLKTRRLSSIFSSDNVDKCKDYVEGLYNHYNEILNQLKNQRDFIIEKSNSSSISGMVSAMISCVNGGDCNLSRWYNNKRISIDYMSVSKSCRYVVLKMREDRSWPTMTRLNEIKKKLCDYAGIECQVRSLLADDWYRY